MQSSKTAVIAAIITAIGGIAAALIGGYYLLQNTTLQKTLDLTMTAYVDQQVRTVGAQQTMTSTSNVTNTPQPTFTHQPTYTTEPTIETVEVPPTAIPTVQVIATPLPLGSVVLGIFNSDGEVIDDGEVRLYPRVKLDAAGNLQGDREIYDWQHVDVGLVKFAGLEPNTYIICLGYFGSWVKGGEIVVEPYKEIRQDIIWPRYEMGGSCNFE